MQQEHINISPSRHNRWYEQILLNPLFGHFWALTAIILSVITNFVFGSLRSPQMTGGSEMVGKTARVVAAFDETGQVECEGSVYMATTDVPLKAKQKVIVQRTQGIRLFVVPKT